MAGGPAREIGLTAGDDPEAERRATARHSDGLRSVVQTAAKLVLEPMFEADFEDKAYGYRPAVFDSIPHDEHLKSVARRVGTAACSG
jgi:hypothetical protein